MKILIFSDSHGIDFNMDTILRRERDVDMVLHAGDIGDSQYELKSKTLAEVNIVRGNCDWFCDLPVERTINIGKNKIYLRHGDGYVNYNPESLIGLTDANIIIFGHTHVPYYKEVNGKILFNPGSISKPRTDDKKASYGLMEIDEEGNISLIHKYL